MADTTVCAGHTVLFAVQVSGTIQTYQWQVNSGNGFVNISNGGFYSGAISDSLTISGINTSLSGNIYRCVVSGPCTANLISATATLNVNPLPVANIIATGPLVFCPGDSVILNANTGLGLTYQWKLNGINIPGATSASYTAFDSGIYSVSVTNTGNCTTVSSALTVAHHPVPVAITTPTGPDSVCSNDTLTLHVGATSNATYQWKRNGNNISAATDTIYRTNTAGIYTVSVTNTYGCITASSPILLTVNFITVPPVFTLMGSPVFCDGDSLILGTSSLYSSYQWQKNGINIPGATGISYTIHSGGNYRVIGSTLQCSAASSLTNVIVEPLPVDSLIISWPPVICSATGSYTVSAFPVAGQLYQWYKNGLIIYGAISTNYVATVAAGYNVEITNSVGCSIFTNSVFVSYVNSPNPVITAQGFTLHTNSFYNSYQWYLNNLPIPGAITDTYTASQNGDYTVFVTDSNNCSNMSAKHTISDLEISNIRAGSDKISIYPNPATTLVKIDALEEVSINISAVDGRVVLKKEHAKYIDLSSLADGVYIIRVFDENNNLVKTAKLVKKAL